ncbi:MAG: hypothetical protein AAF985_21355 [Bacteroidota bacterium]
MKEAIFSLTLASEEPKVEIALKLKRKKIKSLITGNALTGMSKHCLRLFSMIQGFVAKVGGGMVEAFQHQVPRKLEKAQQRIGQNG